MRTLSWLIVVPLALLACNGDDNGGGDTDPEGFTHPSLDLTGDPAAGADVYSSSCASCHAADGTGGTGNDLTASVPGQTREELTEILVEGIEGTSMVSYDDILSDQEMADVVAYMLDEWGS